MPSQRQWYTDAMRIYFSGIGGVGIGPLAQIAIDAGYEVLGSDRAPSPITAQLQTAGVAVDFGQDGSFLRRQHESKRIDELVYTSALPADHPELQVAHSLGIKTLKRDELLNEIIRVHNLRLLAVAGTHGKTTTVAMLVWLFRELNIAVSYSVGTTLSFGPSGHFNRQGKYFIYECDEFDRNFLHFSPELAIITSLDYDHPDTYPTTADYRQAFRQFINQSHRVIMWPEDDPFDRLPNHITLVQGDTAEYFSLTGNHNRRNAALAASAAETLELASPERIRAILNRFPGSSRRFERLAEGLYSDYGHHPTEIVATLQLARELSDHVVLVYQPHQNRRQHDLVDLYKDQFEAAEMIYWLPTYLSREDPQLPILRPEELTRHLTNREAVRYAAMNDELWQSIEQARKAGKLVVLMGAGSIDSWAREHLARGTYSTAGAEATTK